MVIDKVGGVGPGYGPRKADATPKKENSAIQSDNVVISDEAARAAEVDRLSKMAMTSQDSSRVEKLREVKSKLEKGEYDNLSEEVVGKLADRLTDVFFSRVG